MHMHRSLFTLMVFFSHIYVQVTFYINGSRFTYMHRSFFTLMSLFSSTSIQVSFYMNGSLFTCPVSFSAWWIRNETYIFEKRPTEATYSLFFSRARIWGPRQACLNPCAPGYDMKRDLYKWNMIWKETYISETRLA